MQLTLHAGDRVTVTDHAALDEQGQGKRREGCVVRLLSREYAIIYVPRYDAELQFWRNSWLTTESRLEVTGVEWTRGSWRGTRRGSRYVRHPKPRRIA